MKCYYNEHDPKKAVWLRELMKVGAIAPGDVDERSIADVRGSDLAGYTQCHFFAGIGVWSYALRLAGWIDERPVWTASCPCQPFSAAGKRKGKADDRHLWPHVARLVRECRPVIAFGEQVASKDGLAWLDDVFSDLEAEAHTCGAVDSCAAGYGAPHIRQRLYWVAVSDSARCADGRNTSAEREQRGRQQRFHAWSVRAGRVEHSEGIGRGRRENDEDAWRWECASSDRGATNGFWRDAAWIYCKDGKYRPIESWPQQVSDGTFADLGFVRDPSGGYVTFPLIQKGKARTSRLRGYGDAIVAPQAAAFIRCVMEELDGSIETV